MISPRFPHQQPAATRLRYHYTTLSSQPKTKWTCSFVPVLVTCKGIVDNNSPFTKDIGYWGLETKGFRESHRHYHHGVTYSSVFSHQIVDRLPFESLKPPFPLFASLWSLLSSSDREKRHKFELGSLEMKSHKEIQHEIAEKSRKKALKCGENRPPPKKSPSTNWTRTFWEAYGQNRCGRR